MKDHYNMKKQWELTLESWDKSTKKSKKVNTKEACDKTHKGKKKVKVKEEDGGAVGDSSDGATTTDNIANVPTKVGCKAGQLCNKKPEQRSFPEKVSKESIQRTLDKAFNKALWSESIAFQEEEDEDMGMEDDIDDIDEPDMVGDNNGDVELPVGDDEEEIISPELDGEEIPDSDIDSDVNTRLDKIETMLQQLLDIESSEGEISDIEGEDAADLMGDVGMGTPVEPEPISSTEGDIEGDIDIDIEEGISDPGPGGSGRTPPKRKLKSIGKNKAIDDNGKTYTMDSESGYYKPDNK